MTSIFSLLKLMTLLAMLIVYSVHGDGADMFKEDEEEHNFYLGDNVAIGRVKKRISCGLTYRSSDADLHGDKIVGGSYTMPGEVPWVVGIQVRLFDTCAAAIVSEYWVITAAHCVYDASPDKVLMTVTAGDRRLCCRDKGEEIYLVAKVILHPHYQSTQLDYDIALLKIKAISGRGIKFNKYSQPVCLPDARALPGVGTPLLVAGWGRDSPSKVDSSSILKKTTLPVMNHRGCRLMFSRKINNNMICAGNGSTRTALCKGDSGDPAVHKSNGYYTIYGVTSFNIRECNVLYPTILSSIPAYRQWIDDTIRTNSNGSELDMPQRPVWKQSTPKPQTFRSTFSSSPSSFVITFLPGLWPIAVVFCMCLVPLK